ncbi:hypothetical protein [Streptomyces anulatus]|uniref:Uncharacterized protein n=1 Tax=Streptomyces anulatus TaxID=1892 RepID=A0A7K3RML5_STRAQ|nr:hypothetical protein [Streptomyces anulatus]NEC03428.1 hypothetical protein [Streptomyces anulatus]NED30728.1 hypothetical protein [Streptomyces anulatus]
MPTVVSPGAEEALLRTRYLRHQSENATRRGNDSQHIDSVHPEESIETFRERMTGFKMMAQTIFLADEQPAADSCRLA